jgi:GNAT superfamily N-acetyltransferase
VDPVDDRPGAVQLLDGRTVGIRPISASDGEALVRFHEGLTDETTRLRFFALHPHLALKEVERFTHVDHHDREALVLVDGPDIVAVGRYDCIPGTSDAEVAFVVADDWQGHGAGTHLLEQLVQRARGQGVKRLVADTLGENRRMRDVLRHSGPMVFSATGAGVVRVMVDLGPEPLPVG